MSALTKGQKKNQSENLKQKKRAFLYLSQRVPVCDGLPRIRQHFVPVVSSKAHGIRTGSTHTDYLIMSNPVKSLQNWKYSTGP